MVGELAEYGVECIEVLGAQFQLSEISYQFGFSSIKHHCQL